MDVEIEVTLFVTSLGTSRYPLYVTSSIELLNMLYIFYRSLYSDVNHIFYFVVQAESGLSEKWNTEVRRETLVYLELGW